MNKVTITVEVDDGKTVVLQETEFTLNCIKDMVEGFSSYGDKWSDSLAEYMFETISMRAMEATILLYDAQIADDEFVEEFTRNLYSDVKNAKFLNPELVAKVDESMARRNQKLN